MKLAVMSDKPSMFGLVPDTFETSPCMLIWDTDEGGVCAVLQGCTPEEYAKAALEHDCEAVVCGPHIGQSAFDILADACITRYEGAGLRLHDAVRGAYFSTLELIREYEGGPGCDAGHGSCDDGHCGGHEH